MVTTTVAGRGDVGVSLEGSSGAGPRAPCPRWALLIWLLFGGCAAETAEPSEHEQAREPDCSLGECDNRAVPQVTSVEPMACDEPACAAPVETVVRVRFTEPIDPRFADGGQADCTGAVVVWAEGVDPQVGPCVTGTVQVDQIHLIFTPDALLEPSTAYDVFIATTIRDLWDTALLEPLQWRFRTQDPPICGNGQLSAGEACDDGNLVDGDYCSSDCLTANGSCGDSAIQASVESCDDGNNLSADGCSARCLAETHEAMLLPAVDASCGLRPDGTLRCWGGLLDPVPEGLFDELAAGDDFACALAPPSAGTATRTLVCWGGFQMAAEMALSDIVARGDQICGLTATGGVQCLASSGGQALALAGDGYTRLAVGAGFVCGLDAAGAVRCSGSVDASSLSSPQGLIDLAAGDDFVCALDASGTTQCAGGGAEARGLRSPPQTAFVALAAGGQALCGKQMGGMLVCWHTGGGASSSPGTAPMAHFALGPSHGCGITAEGLGVCWAEGDLPGLSVPADFP